MGSFIDRAMQRRILEAHRDVYPGQLGNYQETLSDDYQATNFNQNVYYLCQHGLIEGVISTGRSDPLVVAGSLTEFGADFLELDGGISAMHRSVSVRFDEDQVRRLLVEVIEQSAASGEEKSKLIHLAETLSTDALRALVAKGVENLPDIARLILSP